MNQVADRLYTLYCKHVGGKAFNGDALPTWAEFSSDPAKQVQVNTWLKVAEEAMRLTTLPGCKFCGNPTTGTYHGELCCFQCYVDGKAADMPTLGTYKV